MSYCNIDAILQLVRPDGVKRTYLEVSADSSMVDMFNKRIRKEGLLDEYISHPLIKTTTEAQTCSEEKDEARIQMVQILTMAYQNDM
jgi:hypothetical protein